MFFNSIVTKLGFIPEYYLNDLIEHQKKFVFSKDTRQLLGMGSQSQSYFSAEPDVKLNMSNISIYIMSQQHEFLKNLVSYELSIVNTPNNLHVTKLPTRYICRVGEQIVVPLTSAITVTSKDKNNIQSEGFIMEPGYYYRLNNRITSSFISDPNFMAIVVMYVDFDLKKYLLPHDFNSPFPRQKDEFFNEEDAKNFKEIKSVY